MPNNHFSTTNLAATDLMEDTPTNSYCTMNPLDTHSSNVLSEGNLNFGSSGSAGHYPTFSTMGMRSGKWYWEASRTGGAGWIMAIMSLAHDSGSLNMDSTVGNSTSSVNKVGYSIAASTGNKSHDYGSEYNLAYGSAIGTGGVLMCAFDADNGKIWWGKDGTWFGSGDPANGTNAAFTGIDTDTDWGVCIHCYSGHLPWMNFGADPTFGGNVSTPDTSEFKHTPPTGFKSLSTGNLATPTIAKPSEHFDTLTYTGSSSSLEVDGLEFTPNFVWFKKRNGTEGNYLVDDVRGISNGLVSNTSDAEDTSQRVTSFDDDGFTLVGANGYTNESSSYTYVAWSWKGGTTATQSGTHTYELALELTDSDGMGWGGMSMYTTPRLEVIEGTTSLGHATVGYYQSTANYVIKTNNKDAIKIVWDYNSTAGGDVGQQGATLKNGSTVIQTAWTTSDTVVDGEVWITQSTSTDETTVGTLATGTPASYPSSSYNAAAGFSIAKWTGDDTGSGSGQTVNHNLGVAPEMIIAKNRTSTASGNGDWMVYHKDVTSGYYMRLNTNGSETVQYTNTMQSITSVKVDFYSDSGAMNYLNYGGGLGYAAEDYIAYMFASVEGYSKVGSYEGNNSTDGPFVYCGFRPRWICVKRIDGLGPWVIIDTARDPYNDTDATLAADASSAESSYAATSDFDILSNGFKLRHSVTYGYANNADTYIFYSVAESPLKTANAR